MRMRTFVWSAIFVTFPLVHSATPDEWRSRSIYQLLTDRFARTDLSTTADCPLGFEGFCGGTYVGLVKKLDYIQGMGFDAVWISPVTKNIDNPSRAYHGYSQQDLYSVNTPFGTADDLRALSSALHSRGMYLMVDVVANHFGYNGNINSIDYSTMNPFNDASYFNPTCYISNWDNQTEVELCELGAPDYPLPDVRTTLSSVRSEYQKWIKQLVSNYSIDGIRIDTVKHVEMDFWGPFQQAAGVYAVGEVANGNVDYVCPYQNQLNGVLNYPLYYQITNFFKDSSTSPQDVINVIRAMKSQCKDTNLLAPFSENHDQPRFPFYSGDQSLAENIIAFTLLTDGIPIIYAGQEQHLNGSDDPSDREAIWLTGYNTNSALYQHIAKLNKLRKHAISKSNEYTSTTSTLVYQDLHSLAYRKGGIVGVYTNQGSSASSTLTVENSGYVACTQVMEVLSCTQVQVQCNGGALPITIVSGRPLVYYPLADLGGSGICNQ